MKSTKCLAYIWPAERIEGKDNAMQLIIWLLTKATDKCQTIEEVRELNKEIRSYLDKTKEGLSDKERDNYTYLSEMYRSAVDDAVFVAYNKLFLGLLNRIDEALAGGRTDVADSLVKELIKDIRKTIKA